MLKKLMLLLFTSTSMLADLSPVQLNQLRQQFNQALTSEQIPQAQTIVKQISDGGKTAIAAALEGQVKDKIIQIQKRNEEVAANQRAKEDAERKKKASEQEAQQRETQAAQEKQRREQEEARLKSEVERNATAENNKKLLAQIHEKNIQLDELGAQNIRLQSQLAAQQANAEKAALETKIKYDEQTADAIKKAAETARKLCDQLVEEVTKEKEVLRQSVSGKANEEYRTRLAEAEKACQAQTKKAEEAEQSCKNSNAQLVKTQQDLKKQIDECKKLQSSQEAFAKQAQQSPIIQKKMDDLLAANQKYEKQVSELTKQLQDAKKEIEDLKTEDNQKADKIFTLETDAEAEKQLKEKAQKELQAIQKEIREITKELNLQKEAYQALAADKSRNQDRKLVEEKCAADLEAAKKKCNESLKEETQKIYKNVKEQIAQYRDKKDAEISTATAARQSAISFANGLMRQKEIKPKDIQDLIDILQQR